MKKILSFLAVLILSFPLWAAPVTVLNPYTGKLQLLNYDPNSGSALTNEVDPIYNAQKGNYVLKAGDTMTGTLTIETGKLSVKTGSVGIGTTALPSDELVVYSSNESSDVGIQSGAVGDARLMFRRGAGGGLNVASIGWDRDTDLARFGYGGVWSGTDIRINSTGEVGIDANPYPGATLNVGGNLRVTGTIEGGSPVKIKGGMVLQTGAATFEPAGAFIGGGIVDPVLPASFDGIALKDKTTGTIVGGLGRLNISPGPGWATAFYIHPLPTDFGALFSLMDGSGNDIVMMNGWEGIRLGSDMVDTASGKSISVTAPMGVKRFNVDGTTGDITGIGTINLTGTATGSVGGDFNVAGTLTASDFTIGVLKVNDYAHGGNQGFNVADVLLVNGPAVNIVRDWNMEDPTTGYWGVFGTAPTISKVADERTDGTGIRSLRATATAAGMAAVMQTGLTPGRMYNVSFWYKTDGIATPAFQMGSSPEWQDPTKPIVWTHASFSAIASGVGSGGFLLFNFAVGAGDWVQYDDVSIEVVAGENEFYVNNVNGDIETKGFIRQLGTSGSNIFCGNILMNDVYSIISDGNMESAGTTNWSYFGGCTNKVKDTVTFESESGSQSLKVTSDGSGNFGVYHSISFVTGTKYHITGWARPDGSNVPFVNILNSGGGSPGPSWVGSGSLEWQYFDFYWIATAGNDMIGFLASSPASIQNIWYDNITVTPMTGISQSVITPGGRIGLGTLSPSHRIQSIVPDSGNMQAAMFVQNDLTNNPIGVSISTAASVDSNALQVTAANSTGTNDMGIFIQTGSTGGGLAALQLNPASTAPAIRAEHINKNGLVQTWVGPTGNVMGVFGTGNLFINASSEAFQPVVSITNPSAQRDIQGNNGNWYINPDGTGSFESLFISGTIEGSAGQWEVDPDGYARFNGGLSIGGNFSMVGKFSTAKTQVVSDADLILPYNVVVVTGNNTIDAIVTSGVNGWPAGAQVVIIFTGSPTVKHNTAGGAGTQRIFLAGSSDMSAEANAVLGLVNDGTQWQEQYRKFP